jgi:hypothetical protein
MDDFFGPLPSNSCLSIGFFLSLILSFLRVAKTFFPFFSSLYWYSERRLPLCVYRYGKMDSPCSFLWISALSSAPKGCCFGFLFMLLYFASFPFTRVYPEIGAADAFFFFFLTLDFILLYFLFFFFLRERSSSTMRLLSNGQRAFRRNILLGLEGEEGMCVFILLLKETGTAELLSKSSYRLFLWLFKHLPSVIGITCWPEGPLPYVPGHGMSSLTFPAETSGQF